MKLDSVIDLIVFGLSPCILDHFVADVYAHERHRRIGLGDFNEPAAGPTANIEQAMKDSRVSLVWQDTAHCSCDHLILDRQTGKFILALSVLNEVGTGKFFHAQVLLKFYTAFI